MTETFSMGKVYHHPTERKASWTQLGDPLIKRPNFGYYLPESKAPKGTKGWGGGAAYEASNLPESEYFQEQLATSAIARLKAMKKNDKPGFLAVGFTKPHLPFVAPRKYWDLYNRKDLRLAPRFDRKMRRIRRCTISGNYAPIEAYRKRNPSPTNWR